MPVLPGLLPLRRILSKGEYELRVDLEDFEGEVRYAKYSGFSIGISASSYTLEAVGYSGDAGLYRKFGLKEIYINSYLHLYLYRHEKAIDMIYFIFYTTNDYFCLGVTVASLIVNLF